MYCGKTKKILQVLIVTFVFLWKKQKYKSLKLMWKGIVSFPSLTKKLIESDAVGFEVWCNLIQTQKT